MKAGDRVVVSAPQGSCYDGRLGTIVRIERETAFVRLDGLTLALPFGLCELRARS